MINQLKIFHSEHSKGAPLPNCIQWKTCLRTIGFTKEDHPEVDHRGVSAYEFLLQVICGLHSPMIGETEIMAQFKIFLETNADVIPQKVSQSLLKEAKKLRTKYLKNYGAQSYGSYTLKESKGLKSIVIFGAGGLCQEILPILKSFAGEIVVYCRNPEKYLFLKEKYPHLILKKIDSIQFHEKSLIVIAAPIKTDTLEKIINESFSEPKVLDMRSITDGPSLALNKKITYKNLDSIFLEIESTQKVLKLTSLQMKKEIKEISKKWESKAQVRPFGWEDLCC